MNADLHPQHTVEHVRFRGTVQGVGFRPTVARLARAHGLRGWVRNDGEGVLVALLGSGADRDAFVTDLLDGLPPLARVDAVERDSSERGQPVGDDFVIVQSQAAGVRTPVTADAATCPACAEEIRDPFSRRYRYPLTNCTHCGPRYTVVTDIPWDRPNTTIASFTLCTDCQAEYEDETDRRYHAEPIACGRCGPNAEIVRTDGSPVSFATYSMLDDVDAARTLVQRGEIVAVKGLGGYQLCCDATNADAVQHLRDRKQRPDKPLAMMAWDVALIRRFCSVDPVEEQALQSPAAPIVLLRADGPERLPEAVAPGQAWLGFMLPSTPLHLLMLRGLDRPIVCTSGNLVDEPQCTEDDEALTRLGGIADWVLRHDRPIAHRVDDSVVRCIAGQVRPLRRARGYAPAPVALHESFAAAPAITALGGQLKSTFCLLDRGQATLSPHLGDLDEPRTLADYAVHLRTLTRLFEHAPHAIAMDVHPGYRSEALLGIAQGSAASNAALHTHRLPHHHAHAAACMADNGLPVDAPPVLALVLDGLGMGDDGDLWGGELLRADFRRATRLAALPAVALLGGDRAAREPWRNALAHLVHALGWEGLADHADLDVVQRLLSRRTSLVERALHTSPRASSAGRLFDAVAAVLDLHFDGISYEAQAATALESVAARAADDVHYPVNLLTEGFDAGDVPRLGLATMWAALLADLAADVDIGIISRRFHAGLAQGLADACAHARGADDTVALSGGCFQNALLTELTAAALTRHGFSVLLHHQVPANDGGLSLGQAAIAAARELHPLPAE